MRVFHALSVLCASCMLAAVRVCDAAPAAGTRDVWVEVRINDVTQPDFALLHVDMRGHLSARVEDLRAWHMKPPGSAAPGSLVRIDDVPGVHTHLEADDMLLRIEADPVAFEAQIIDDTRHVEAPDRGVPAVFLGYNLFAERDGGMGETYSALVEAGSSLGRASFTSSWLGTRVADSPVFAAPGVGDGQSGWHRLDTALLLDFPEYTARLTVGDSVTGPGTLGDSVRFSGVHWATDYVTRPGITPYSLPVVSGTANVPSSIEVYLNNALVQRTSVDAGPFQLNNIPIPVGEGSVDIRMRDMLGQVQQVSVPYLVSPQIIAAGLTTVDLAAGVVREDYGIESFAYGQSFLSGGVLHGLDSNTTLNASAELLPDQFTTRGGAAFRVTRNVTADLTPAVSHASGEGTGGAVVAGIDGVWSSAAFGMHYTNATPRYVELGSLAPGERLHTQWAAQTSTQLGHWGSLALLYAWRRSYGEPATAATTLTYNLSLRRLGAIGMFVADTRSGGSTDVIGGITFTRYLGKGVTASVTDSVDNGASTVDMQVGQPAPPDAGFGWEVAHARGQTDTDGLRIDARSSYGTGSGEVDATPQGTLGILSWQGGFLWAGGRPWPAQTLAGPAALVVVPDLGGVEVLHDGQPVGRTDGEGRILVPALRPFEDNFITVVPEDIPLTAMVDSDRITVRPYSHGVVSAVVSVAASESRVFTLRLGTAADGFVPPGAEVALNGHTYPVGTQGISQLPVGHAAVDASVSWPGGRCRLHVPTAAAVTSAAAKRSADRSAAEGIPGSPDGATRGDGPLGVECKRP
jgi:outer membrane usher protein